MRDILFLLIIVILLFPACDRKTDTISGNRDTGQARIYFKNGYSQVGPVKMYYEIHGTGKPLVLIHGGGSTIGTSFGQLIPLLSEQRQLIAVELQGHGHTQDADRPESFEQDADDVARLLKNLQIPEADILGFSNGGNTSMQIALRHPEMVRKLVLISAFYKRDGMVKGFFESMERATFKDMPDVYKEAFLKINNDSSKLRAMFEKDRARMVQFKDWKDTDLSSIKAPAFVINGDRDVVTAAHAAAMAGLIPNARLAILPGEHGRYIGELMTRKAGDFYPAFTARMIEEFLDAPDK